MAKEDLRPLATVVEQVWGKPEHEQYYTRAYFNWVHMLYMVDPRQGKFDEAKCEELVSKMSETQITSLQLLRQWWDGEIQEKELSDEIGGNILSSAMAPLMTKMDLADAPVGLAEAANSIVEGESLAFNPKFEESSYHEALFQLWSAEFLIRDGLYDFGLQATREWAAIAACNQRVAWLSFKDVLAGSKALMPSEAQGQRKLIPPMRTSLTVCPWLGLKDKKASQKGLEGLPHYLWDVKHKRTVEVSTLISDDQRPEYIAVSHTWGRWRLRTKPAVAVHGVPWKVPLNSRFDVETMGQTLDSKIPYAEYIWIDVYCIPQETEDAELIRIRDSEIARQGEIFSNAKSAIVWFNDVTSWKGLETAVLWFAATFLKQSRSRSEAGTAILEPWAQLFEKEADKNPSGLFEEYEYSGKESLKSATPSGWFTSLWTLQEACLCPHILLAQRDWRLFAVGPKNLILTLDNLVAIVVGFQLHQENMQRAEFSVEEFEPFQNVRKIVIDAVDGLDSRVQELVDRSEPIPGREAFLLPHMPRAASELLYVFADTELTQMLDISPLKILVLANQRYCKHSRAQAIMSVLGATKWFSRCREEHGSRPSEDNLVLGTFPVEFVREVKTQLGVEFFSFSGSGFEVCLKEVFKKWREAVWRSIPLVQCFPSHHRGLDQKQYQQMSTRNTVKVMAVHLAGRFCRMALWKLRQPPFLPRSGQLWRTLK
jgi:hypothetical protein